MYCRPSDLAQIARDEFERVHNSIRFSYFGTKGLRSVPKFPQKQGLSMFQSHQTCVVVALEAYIDLTADPSVYLHDDPVPFKPMFIDFRAFSENLDRNFRNSFWTNDCLMAPLAKPIGGK